MRVPCPLLFGFLMALPGTSALAEGTSAPVVAPEAPPGEPVTTPSAEPQVEETPAETAVGVPPPVEEPPAQQPPPDDAHAHAVADEPSLNEAVDALWAAFDALPNVQVYGLLKPTVVVGNAHESFGFPTFVAPTAAGNPVFSADPDAPAWSLQLQQSRFGIKIGEGEAVGGVLELDFVHFDQSSPVQQAFPRLRLAQIEFSPWKGHKLVFGQGWDLFSPLVPHTFDLVAAMFQSGNAAFLRPQAMWLSTFGSVELGAALGLQAPNATPSLSNTELGLSPTLALRGTWRQEKWLMLALSAIGGLPRFQEPDGNNVYRFSAGVALSTELNLGPLALRGEGYGGMNLANLGALTLSQGSLLDDVYEVGGFVSAKVAFLDIQAVTAAVGGAIVTNPDSLALGYAPATATAPAIRVPAQGPGIENNLNVRIGYVVTPMKNLSFVVEPMLFLTRHKLDSSVSASPDRLGLGLEAGARLDF